MKTNVTAPLTGALAILAALALPVSAARLAYEGFDYTQAIGTSVAGLNGGTGWTEAFPTPDGNHLLATGLTFTGLTTAGKSMARSGGTLTADGRNWATSVNTAETYWYSFLLNSSSHEGTFNLFQAPASNQNGTGLELRKDTLPSTNTIIKATGNGGVVTVRSVPSGQTHWVLGKVTSGANEVWVYAQGEALPTAEASLPAGVKNTGTVLAV